MVTSTVALEIWNGEQEMRLDLMVNKAYIQEGKFGLLAIRNTVLEMKLGLVVIVGVLLAIAPFGTKLTSLCLRA